MKEQVGWKLVNPEGVVEVKALNMNPHPVTLEGKNVLLRWNGKHNGDAFLSRIAELLTENIKDIRIIKNWEVVPETATLSSSSVTSKEFARRLADLKPDISIGSQAD